MSEPFAGIIRDEDALRQIIKPPHQRARDKQIDRLDLNCREFIARAPFVLVGTTNADGTGDVSPKGGPPGFVTVLDEHRLAFGELPGNGRVSRDHQHGRASAAQAIDQPECHVAAKLNVDYCDLGRPART